MIFSAVLWSIVMYCARKQNCELCTALQSEESALLKGTQKCAQTHRLLNRETRSTNPQKIHPSTPSRKRYSQCVFFTVISALKFGPTFCHMCYFPGHSFPSRVPAIKVSLIILLCPILSVCSPSLTTSRFFQDY